MDSILGNGSKWFDCPSDKQQQIKLSRNIASIQFQVQTSMVSEVGWTNSYYLA